MCRLSIPNPTFLFPQSKTANNINLARFTAVLGMVLPLMFLKRTWVQFLEHTINCNSSFRRCNTGTRHAYKAHTYMSEKHSSNKSFSKIIYASNGKISKLIHEVPISFMIQKTKTKKRVISITQRKQNH